MTSRSNVRIMRRGVASVAGHQLAAVRSCDGLSHLRWWTPEVSRVCDCQRCLYFSTMFIWGLLLIQLIIMCN